MKMSNALLPVHINNFALQLGVEPETPLPSLLPSPSPLQTEPLCDGHILEKLKKMK